MHDSQPQNPQTQNTPPDPAKPLPDQIRDVYARIDFKMRTIQTSQRNIKAAEANAMIEVFDDYMDAKNGDQRKALLVNHLKDDIDYHADHAKIAEAEDDLKLLYLKRDMLRDVTEAAKTPGQSF